METPPRHLKSRVVSWKQIPTVALAGWSLAGVADSSASPVPSFAVLPARASQDWSVSAPWLRARGGPADLTAPRPFRFQRDYVLGTSFDLVVWTTYAQEAARVEGVVLAEIDRLGRILSRYDSQSEISRLNAGCSLATASPDLIAILRAYEIWTPRTGGALSGRLGGLIRLWKTAEVVGTTPAAADLADCLEDLRGPGWRIDSGQVRPLGHSSLNVDCLGKGYILQKAVETARAGFPGIWGIMLNIGGDISVWGNGTAEANTPWRIFCADPHRPFDNAPPLTSIALSQGAVATSAAYERGFTVAGQRYSHILDPRNGWPARGVFSATAVARDSLTANALATALCVLMPDEGINLLRAIEGVEGLIVATDGAQFRTPGFSALELPFAQVSPAPDSTVPVPSPTPSSVTTPAPSETPATSASAAPIAPGQIVTIVTSDQVSFVKGTGHIKRPVQPEEKFRVVSVTGDAITVADLFGYQATLDRTSLKLADSAPPPAPVATAPAVTNTAPTPSPNPVPAPAAGAQASSWPANYQVTLGLELPLPPPGARRVERPFVAMWVEDADGKPIRTIAVWGQGKWLADLSNWWAFAKGQPQLISNTTRATRPAGKYQVVWDGLDDAGKPAARGAYTLVLEVSREFGGHDIHRGTIQCGDLSAQGTIPGAREFLDCPLTYGPPSS